MLQWLRHREKARRLVQADAEALPPLRDHGTEAYGEARQRERDMVLPTGRFTLGGASRFRRASRIKWRRTP
jgi:hypothetical protein